MGDAKYRGGRVSGKRERRAPPASWTTWVRGYQEGRRRRAGEWELEEERRVWFWLYGCCHGL